MAKKAILIFAKVAAACIAILALLSWMGQYMDDSLWWDSDELHPYGYKVRPEE